MRRLKFTAPASEEKLSEKPNDTPYVGLENIESKTGRLLIEAPIEQVESAVGVFRPGDVLFGKLRPYLAKVFHADFHGVCTAEILPLRPADGVDGNFIHYQLLEQGFIDLVNSMTYGAKMPRASSTQIGQVALPLPPVPEQRAMAAFLDRETAKVDALIAKKERLIELLREKRAALISRAVTKGLDPSAPMKDSGVEWLGEIPAHWEVRRLGRLSESLQTGPFGSQLHAEDYLQGGIPVINPTNLQGGGIVPDDSVTVDEATFARLQRHSLSRGDIVFARRGVMGRCALVGADAEGWLCGTGSLRVRLDSTLALPEYMGLCLSTAGVGDYLGLESVGSTMENLNTSILSRIPLPVPPLAEQVAIAQWAAVQSNHIAQTQKLTQRATDLLHEYRTALISGAVTGKIDVRGEAG